MPFGNALSLFALYIVSVCGAFLLVPFALFVLFLAAHASFILRCAVCFITCQTFFIFSALLAFMYEALATHQHSHTHNVILRFRLKAFLSTRSVSVSLYLSLSFSPSHPGSTMSSSCSLHYFLYLFLLASSTGNVTDHQVVLENGQKING